MLICAGLKQVISMTPVGCLQDFRLFDAYLHASQVCTLAPSLARLAFLTHVTVYTDSPQASNTLISKLRAHASLVRFQCVSTCTSDLRDSAMAMPQLEFVNAITQHS